MLNPSARACLPHPLDDLSTSPCGAFRSNVKAFLEQHGTPVELGLSGLKHWRVHLEQAGPTATLHVFEELSPQQHDPCCDPCRIIGRCTLLQAGIWQASVCSASLQVMMAGRLSFSTGKSRFQCKPQQIRVTVCTLPWESFGRKMVRGSLCGSSRQLKHT